MNVKWVSPRSFKLAGLFFALLAVGFLYLVVTVPGSADQIPSGDAMIERGAPGFDDAMRCWRNTVLGGAGILLLLGGYCLKRGFFDRTSGTQNTATRGT